MSESHGHGSSDFTSTTAAQEHRGNSRGDGRESGPYWRPDTGTRDRLRGFANRQKDAGAEKISGFADAAHKAADALAEQNSGMADLVHEAADGLNRVSDDLRGRDVSDIYGSLNDFARRQPLAFFACALAGGVLLSRFLKSTGERSARPESSRSEHQYHPSPNL